jgi:hypothetical protein
VSLTLDADGRYIQGIDCGKVAMLLSEGARRRSPPRKFPLRRGRQLICVVVNRDYDAALWVQDDVDFQRCRDETERLTVWLEMKTEPLVSADRLPAEQTVDKYEDRAFPDMWR